MLQYGRADSVHPLRWVLRVVVVTEEFVDRDRLGVDDLGFNWLVSYFIFFFALLDSLLLVQKVERVLKNLPRTRLAALG